MKKTIFTFAAALLAASASYAQQIPNASFENWNTTAGYNNPDGWGNTNSVMGSMGTYTVTKGTPGNPGNAYIKIITVSAMGTMIPGVAVSGTLDITDPGNIKYSGFAYAGRPTSLTGKWQYMAGGANDKGFVSTLFTKWNTTTQSRDTIGSSRTDLQGMVMSWADFSIPITYSNTATPDSALIILSASGAGMALANNSTLFVDDLAFIGGSTGISTTSNLVENLTVYPIPANNRLTIAFEHKNTTQKLSLELIDLQGRILIQQAIKATQFNLDISSIASGNYFLKITDGKQVQSQKVVIEK